MLGNLGFSLLLLALLTSVYGSLAAFAAAALSHRRALRSSSVALYCEWALALGAVGILLHALITGDFTLDYVASQTSADLPLLYRVSALWASLAGSHLFWTAALCSVLSAASLTIKRQDEALKPFFLGAAQLLLAWMFFALVTHSDPFLAAAHPGDEGTGLNPLLRNPYMVLHPPLLFIGYSLLAVPFLYAVCALLCQDRSASWLESVRRWALAAFVVLTVAIALGGRWAYEVLGWGGYWAWDPVENASLLPWLLDLALLHILAFELRGRPLPRLTVALTLLAFISTFFGTLLTRSGIVSSVHAFAKSAVGPGYLCFLTALAGSSLLLYGWRAPRLPATRAPAPMLLREGATALGIFLLLAFALVVFTGMLFPIIAEAIFDTRFSVQAPYFNSFAPPVGMALLALMAAKSMGARGTRRRAVLGPLLLALATALAYRWFMPGYTGDAAVPAAALAGVFCVALCFGAMGWRMARIGARRLVTHRFRSRLAGLVHIGATLAMLGFVGAYHTQNGQLTLRPGERQQLGRFTFLLQGPVVRHEVAHAVHYETSLAVFDRETSVGVATPSIAVYPTGNEASITEVSLLTVGLMDVYVVLSDWDKTDPQGAVTIGVYLNPFVRLVWVAVALMAGGGACALALPGRKRSQG